MIFTGSCELSLISRMELDMHHLLIDLDISNWVLASIILEYMARYLFSCIRCYDVLIVSRDGYTCYQTSSFRKSLRADGLSSDSIPDKDEWLLSILSTDNNLSILAQGKCSDIV